MRALRAATSRSVPQPRTSRPSGDGAGEALEYVHIIATKIILIDGEALVSLMVDHNVAVTRMGTYELKKIDADYFDGE